MNIESELAASAAKVPMETRIENKRRQSVLESSLIAADGELHQLMTQWRRDLHRHPETAYEEHRTAKKVAQLLESFGLDVETGIAVTGVVATLSGNRATKEGKPRSIAFRADMDALNLQELNEFSHCSVHQGKMHGCGHDGHTAMLLGAAKYLAENRDFSARIVFIFQPAEEGEAGAQKMCEEGLFERFDIDAVYGLHNWPGLAAGKFAVHSGPVMAAMDTFDITITGSGGHAGMPHMGIDPVLVAGHLITSLQSVVSRGMSPLDSGVVSVTQMHGGAAYNVIPDSVTIRGTCRTFSATAQQFIQRRMQKLTENVCAGFDTQGSLEYKQVYPATVNDLAHADICQQVAEQLVGVDNVVLNPEPSMGAEDFAFMLQQRPGAYLWLGNGTAEQSRSLHNPEYDFNDEILPTGANYWICLAHDERAK